MGEALRGRVIESQFAGTNRVISAGNDPARDATQSQNTIELKSYGEEQTLHRMARVLNFLEMWLGSKNLPDEQMESCARYNRIIAVECISDTEEIVK